MASSYFHYKKFNECHLKYLLKDNIIRFSSPNEFNDPWDCRMHIPFPATKAEQINLINDIVTAHQHQYPDESENYRKQRASDLEKNPDVFKREIEKVTKNINDHIPNHYKIYCLSSDSNSVLMWAHYAASFSGICIEYDANNIDLNLKESLIKVRYIEEYEHDSLFGNNIGVFQRKAIDWSYEREFRLIAEERNMSNNEVTLKTDNNFFKIPNSLVKSIIYGYKLSSKNEKKLRRIVAKFAPNVALKRAVISERRYAVELEPA